MCIILQQPKVFFVAEDVTRPDGETHEESQDQDALGQHSGTEGKHIEAPQPDI